MKATIKIIALAILAVGVVACSGCIQRLVGGDFGVERTVTINSDPQGATVLIDNEAVGKTPYTFEFIHYGTRKITLMAPGYETMDTLEPIKAPWYQWFPVDFFVDVVLPIKIRDNREFFYPLQPEKGNGDDFRARAEEFRKAEQMED